MDYFYFGCYHTEMQACRIFASSDNWVHDFLPPLAGTTPFGNKLRLFYDKFGIYVAKHSNKKRTASIETVPYSVEHTSKLNILPLHGEFPSHGRDPAPVLPVVTRTSYRALPAHTAVAGTERSIITYPCPTSFYRAFRWMDRIIAKRRAFRAFTTILQILSHFIHGRTITTKSASTLSVNPNMMVTGTDRIAQVHDVEIAVRENR
jgi:hypothetical protein